MAHTLAFKLEQHSDKFAAALKETEERQIVEVSYRDNFWGAIPVPETPTLRGLNMLGKLLTRMRKELREVDGDAQEAAARFLEGIMTEELIINGAALRSHRT